LMPKLAQHACPVMRRAARLHADQCRREPAKRLLHAGALHRAPQHHLPSRVAAVHFEYVLGDVEPNHDSLFHGRSPFTGCLSPEPVWHTDAGWGPSTPSSPSTPSVIPSTARDPSRAFKD